MRVFARRIKHPLDVPIERPQHADARHHGWPVEFDHQEQGFDRGLPILEILFDLGKLLDIVRGVLEGNESVVAQGPREMSSPRRPIIAQTDRRKAVRDGLMSGP